MSAKSHPRQPLVFLFLSTFNCRLSTSSSSSSSSSSSLLRYVFTSLLRLPFSLSHPGTPLHPTVPLRTPPITPVPFSTPPPSDRPFALDHPVSFQNNAHI